MTIVVAIPEAAELPSIAERLAAWQTEPWAGQLHPGDLGWHSAAGAEQTAADLRVWTRHGSPPVAIGMLDGSGVLRMAVDPAAADDRDTAARIVRDLGDPQSGLFASDEAVVEARGARALRSTLNAHGWVEGEPWTPLTLDLSGELDLKRLDRAKLRVERVGTEAAATWTGVHWSAFRATPLDDGTRARFVQRWLAMMTGPLSDRACSLIGYDVDNSPVAVTTVWNAGTGRPGLLEPVGVHRDHRGHGYGIAISQVGARALRDSGSSSAVVVAENSNSAALATYLSAGFTALESVPDLERT